MFRDQLFQNPESSYNMVKEKESCGSHCVIERSHGLNRFGQIVNPHYNILVVTHGWRSNLHEVNGPLIEETF